MNLFLDMLNWRWGHSTCICNEDGSQESNLGWRCGFDKQSLLFEKIRVY